MPSIHLRKLVSASSDKIRFIIVGVANTLTGLTIIYVLKFFFDIPDAPANLVGYVIGVLQSFVLNKSWTFRFTGAALPALPRFLIVVSFAYFSNLFTVLTAIAAGVDSYLAQALGVAPYAVFGYLGNKYFVFPEERCASNN